ncbi:MAG: M48 family metallopeptidase [Ignavibacteria bacterium]
MIPAAYFDGRTSKRHAVTLQAGPHGLAVQGDATRIEPAGRIAVSEPIGGAPRTLRFTDGAFCEVAQGPELDALLAALGHRDGAVVRWQSRWRSALAAVVIVAGLLGAGYRWALPWAAAAVAPHLPPAAVATLSEQVLQALDQRALMPSRLPKERQAQIEREFRQMAAADPAIAPGRLLFRHGGMVGPNAFALPDGRIVLLDELAELAPDEDALLAVLAHELGHATYRHGVRQLLQSSVVAIVVAGYLGDVSTMISGLGALLLESNYSRGFELEADAYGAGLLRASGRSPAKLAEMLETLEAAYARRNGETAAPTGDWLSTHPETAERAARLRALAGR